MFADVLCGCGARGACRPQVGEAERLLLGRGYSGLGGVGGTPARSPVRQRKLVPLGRGESVRGRQDEGPCACHAVAAEHPLLSTDKLGYLGPVVY